MYLVQGIDSYITAKRRKNDEVKQSKRTPSGKLSASMLGEPLQWQVLKTLGVGTRVIEDYVLGKFARGVDTEKAFLDELVWEEKPYYDFSKRAWVEGVAKDPAIVVKTQEFVEYRGCIGFCDAFIDTGVLNGKFGVIPFEVKSVANAKFKRIQDRREPDEHHLLQAALYGLGSNCQDFALTYIASDDYRTLTWVFSTNDYKDKIDGIIDRYNEALANKQVPVFTPIYKWQANLEYNKYPEWVNLDQKAINLALASYYPDAWEKYEAKKAKGDKK